jgi:1,2-phenylacetyl-CoA epoxidase PaaB subunit
MPRWRVDVIGKRLQHVGTVEAATDREAIEAAIKNFRVERMLRDKLVAIKCPEPLDGSG